MAGLRPIAWVSTGALLLLAGCRTPTSITLTITSDVRCEDLRGVSIASGTRASTESAAPATTTFQCAPQGDGTSRIGTLVVVPSGGNDEEIAVRVVAGIDRPVDECSAQTGYQGCIVARRVLRFQPNVEMMLPIELHLDCKSVSCDATTTCVDAGCRSAEVTDPGCVGEGCLPRTDGGVPDANDGGSDAQPDTQTDAPIGETGACADDEKNCGGACVKIDDPAYGCSTAGCSPCDATANATWTCSAGACMQTGCAAGFKSCSGACVPKDAAHGCGGASCTPCPADNGVASCDASGACKLECNTGYKLCGGKCVNVGDPNYGCGPTTCDASSCPSPGAGGTVVCSGSSCVLGSCGPGTKACAGTCVPTDSTHGCGEVPRCTPCAAGETCAGGPPSVCACVPDAKSKTCAGVECGIVKNNCGHDVDCGNPCVAPQTCGGGAAKNKCGCTPSGSPCNGVDCGNLPNSCGVLVACGCTGSNTCGGGGVSGKCGCTPTNPCTGGKCGTFSNGCGGTVTCGCSAPNTCGGGGVSGQCGCTPRTAAQACDSFQVCGPAPNGCGGFVSCGGCPGSSPNCCYDRCVCSGCLCP